MSFVEIYILQDIYLERKIYRAKIWPEGGVFMDYSIFDTFETT